MSSRSPLTGKPLAPRPRPPQSAARHNIRRTQAQRLAETRARIIAATVAYIDERGFHQASLQQVAREAGVTVGAVQHHFASKGDLLMAVVEDNFRQLTNALTGQAFEGRSLQERISLFVDHSWSFCNSPRYQSSLQILLGIRNEGGHDNFEQWVNQTLGQVMSEGFDLWRRVFDDRDLQEEELFNLLLYLFSSLSGSALLARIHHLNERVDSDLRELKHMLWLRLQEKTTQGPRGTP